MKTIVLKFSGPLQSWGTSSNFETRHTDFYPSKSAVIGLIAASCGYRRGEDDKISKLDELDFAVRVDQQGKLCRDYHIARKYKKNGETERTYVTNRYYLEDAVFVVALSHRDDAVIETIATALKRPWFQPFMGRRALPVPADFVLGMSEEGAVECLKNWGWQAAPWYKRQNDKEYVDLELFADARLASSASVHLRKDRVRSFSQEERKFAFRYEAVMHVRIRNCSEE